MNEFDPAAEFLLDWGFINLFDQTETSLFWTCRGCSERVPVEARSKHYDAHRRTRERAKERAAGKVKQARIANLARARQAKKAAA